MMKALRISFAVIFWSWNALFLVLVTAGFAPMVFLDLVADATEGLARWSTVAWAGVLFFLPVVVTIAAALRLRREPAALFVAFFGIEIPALTLALIRLFGFSDLQGAAGVTMASVAVGGLALLAWLARPPQRAPLPRALIHAGLAVFTVGSAYLGFVLAFVTLPAFVAFVAQALVAMFRAPVLFVGAFLPALWSCITIASVFLSPVFTPIAAGRALLRSQRAIADAYPRHGRRTALALTVVPAALLVAVIASGWHQPHVDVLARLAVPPASDAERRAILDDEHVIRAALTDAYLARWRYPADGRDDTLRGVWREVGVPADADASAFHRAIARPFVFDGDAHAARARADVLYRAVFGEEIERTEREAVRDALASNALRDERYAGFMNEGEERVWLAAQSVTVTAHEGWATVEIMDTWMNQTGNDEEVLLSFSLPPDAALTGVWLGADADKAKAFTHVVAPRGAAQQVYNEQVRASRDPALLEQVGPQQYRLRVFPVPARQRTGGRLLTTQGAWHDLDSARPRMHVWLRYEALPDADGRVPFPRLAERRNGFWDTSTTRALDGHDTDAAAAGEWIQAPPVQLAAAPALRAAAGGACWELAPTALPSSSSSSSSRGGPLDGALVDVVLDRSFAMGRHTDALEAALRVLEGTGAQLRFVLTAGAFRGEPAPTTYQARPYVEALVPFGATSPRELLAQHAAVRRAHAEAPRAVVVLAARGSFDTAVDGPLDVPLDAPLFLVHFGGLPAGYDDATADAIARSGGTAVDARDLDDVLRALGPGPDLVVAGRALRRVAGLEGGACEGGPAGVVARLAVRSLDRGRAKDDPATLDALHRIAVAGSVVTPYSSMIVLVDEAQRRRLAELEKQQDRFDREVEQHKEAGAPNVFGAPEPHEWALLVMVAGVLAWLAVQRRRGRRFAF